MARPKGTFSKNKKVGITVRFTPYELARLNEFGRGIEGFNRNQFIVDAIHEKLIKEKP